MTYDPKDFEPSDFERWFLRICFGGAALCGLCIFGLIVWAYFTHATH